MFVSYLKVVVAVGQGLFMLARLPFVRILVFDLLPSALITPIRVGWGPE